jgi:hypothetical protein
VALLDELRASDIKVSAAVRLLYQALGEPVDIKKWKRLAARFRKRRQRRRSAGMPEAL